MTPREIRPGIRRLLRLAVRRPADAQAEMDDEIRLHIALRTEQLVRQGREPGAARAEAEARFGLQDEAQRALHHSAQRRESRMDLHDKLDALGQDLRYAWRGMRRNPGFAAVAALTLALGIGANTAIFSVIDAVMLRSLPVQRPEQMVQVTLGSGGGDDEMSNPLYESLRDRQDVFSGMFAWANRRFDLADGGESQPVDGTWVSGSFFDVLGITPAVGRLLHAADDSRGCAPVAVLAHGYWERSYGGDPSAVGRTIALDGHPFEIVGIADPGFSGMEVGHATQIYLPLCATAVVDGGAGPLDDKNSWFLRIMARRRAGVTTEQASARLAVLAPAVFAPLAPEGMTAERRAEFLTNTLGAVPAATGFSAMRTQYRTALLALMAVVGLVLLIACANVANLLLARAVARRREIAIRLAVGARRGRLVRQLFTESALLALVGGALGLLFAHWASGVLLALLSTRDDAVWLDLAIDGRVLVFTFAVASVTALVFGLAPAWRATRVNVQSAMTTSEQAASHGHGRFAAVKALVVGQIALSLVLLLGAGLLLGTFRRLATMDPGFQREGVLLVTADLRAAHFPDEQRPSVTRQMLERLRAIPGVRSASASSITPISGAGWNGQVDVEGYTPAGRRDAVSFFNAVSDGYFATLGTRLLAGRDFDARDVAAAPKVVVINEAAAGKFFRGRSPIGGRVGIHDGGEAQTATVIGMVRDAKYVSLREKTREVMYLSMAQQHGGPPFINFEVKGSAAAALTPLVTAAVAEVNPRVSLSYQTLSAQVNASLARERMLATLSAFFGALALALAVIGLYGTMSYTLARRRKEIGVRIALGAARSRVIRLVLGEVARLLALGVVLGGAMAYLCTRWVTPFLFGITPIDPPTWVLAAMTLAAAALAAGAVPAWRAATADPMVAIRTD